MKIGLTYTGSEDKHGFYTNWLRGEDGHEVIKLSHKEKPSVDTCDALVLSGGIDVHPRFYGSDRLDYPNADEFDEERDQFELTALQRAIDKNIPVLGICRGMQLINVAMGGTLLQDLGARNDIHRGGPDKRHEVHVEEDTILADFVGVREGDVNSAHHQALDVLGKDLRINCYSFDGTIEGIEGTVKGKFLLAVQWHPERMFRLGLGDTPFSKGIRDRFIASVNEKVLK
jgi:putative glutamine amidotransferase